MTDTPDPAVLSDARARRYPWRACDRCDQPEQCKADGRTCADQADFATQPASDAPASGAGQWWTDAGAVKEARQVFQNGRKALLKEQGINTHLKGVYEPIIAALEPMLSTLAELDSRPPAAAAPKVASGLERVKLVASALCRATGMDPDGGARSGYGWRDHEAAAIELLAVLANDATDGATDASEAAGLRMALEQIIRANQVRHWTATADNPESHWVVSDGPLATIARAALTHPAPSGAWGKERTDADLLRLIAKDHQRVAPNAYHTAETLRQIADRIATTPGGDLPEQAATWLRERAAECHAEAGNLNRNAAARHDQYTACITLDAAANEIVRALSARNQTEGGEK